MEVPRLGVKWELWPLAYTTAPATPDLSHICHLHHSSRQRQVPNPLSKAGDRTCILMDTSQVHFLWATMRTPLIYFIRGHLHLLFWGLSLKVCRAIHYWQNVYNHTTSILQFSSLFGGRYLCLFIVVVVNTLIHVSLDVRFFFLGLHSQKCWINFFFLTRFLGRMHFSCVIIWLVLMTSPFGLSFVFDRRGA